MQSTDNNKRISKTNLDATDGHYLDCRESYFGVTDQRIEWLAQLQDRLMLEKKNPREGRLSISRRSNGVYYSKTIEIPLESHDSKNTRQRKTIYLAEEDAEEIRDLAQQAYNKKALRAVNNELDHYEKYYVPYHGTRVENVFQELSPERRTLVTPVQSFPDARLEEFEHMGNGPRNTYPLPDVPFITEGGLAVRSKSEWIAATFLENEGIPFYYELALHLRGYKTVYPDFTVLNRRTGSIYYWEHFGAMDREDYAQENVAKIKAYEQNGFYMGEKLIATFEAKQLPLTPGEIKSVIERFFL